MDVFVRGHLSQRQSSTGIVTEVTALTITPVMGRMGAARAADDAAESTAEPQSPSELEVCPCAEATGNRET